MKNDIELVFFNFYYKNTFLLNSFLYLQAKKTPNIFFNFFFTTYRIVFRRPKIR